MLYMVNIAFSMGESWFLWRDCTNLWLLILLYMYSVCFFPWSYMYCMLYLYRVDSMLHWCAGFFQNAVFCSYEQVSIHCSWNSWPTYTTEKSVYLTGKSSMCKSSIIEGCMYHAIQQETLARISIWQIGEFSKVANLRTANLNITISCLWHCCQVAFYQFQAISLN